MKTKPSNFTLSPLNLGLMLAFSAGITSGFAPGAYAAEGDEQELAMEEVVAVATRLQGSATAVIEERKQQAFVADIMGAEQISRTGDSDAASALRRVTGLTLVDGKFIYIRGLGERYSSTRLNGANVPSPDLTRNVIPLDIFPSSIISSLSVQKAYSPDMPAAFGGGNVDIRTKTIPSDFFFDIEMDIGGDSASGSGYSYSGGSDDWLGTDDGTRGLPGAIDTAFDRYKADFSLDNIITTEENISGQDFSAQDARAINKSLAKSLNNNQDISKKSLDPDMGFSIATGNSFDENTFGGTLGFMAALSYDNGWSHSEQTSGKISGGAASNDCQKTVTVDCYDRLDKGAKTTNEIKLNGILNLGYQLGDHKVSLSNMLLRNTDDEVEVFTTAQPDNELTLADGKLSRTHKTRFEERELIVTQLLGQHTFNQFYGLGIDWQYTNSTATTDIPNETELKVQDVFDNGVYQHSEALEVTNVSTHGFVEMEDEVESYGWNASLPLFFSDFEVELKAGGDFLEKNRDYRTDVFGFNFNEAVILNTNEDEVLDIGGAFTDEFIDNTDFDFVFNEPKTDDYVAAQLIDAYYGSFDVIYEQKWRISGGLRWEDFRQTSLAFSRQIYSITDFNEIFTPENIENASIVEDDIFSALALTYLGEQSQYRLSYGETIVRPDMREVSPVEFIDPITDLKTVGTVGLKSSPVKHYDARWEYYGDSGNNFSVAAFYKTIEDPIETKLLVGDDSYSLTYLNGEEAKVYGVEAEWLYDLSALALDGLFSSGNITLSDSETVLSAEDAGTQSQKRRMTGHSEYVVNFQLGYDSADGNHSGSLVYNVFGERILAAGAGDRGDAFEQPFHSLDLVYTYYPSYSGTVKFKVQNLLGEDMEVLQDNIKVKTREIGTGFSVSYKHSF
ncbi:TonB-dependent receptor plug domain-containing protein [Thalassomonas actiniarum]|uniref:TonB-dependent receptor plug domain-containing protein n=1 Tax=Thalassomonas actiniarum TaxID=485447 RepID=A0AAE9YQQ6_9GAMM|nr:TonB-dependent receptor plug domain-containing protein [Thalassomonas actiniarum]WDD98549.1 TonB-dependent receptor plug domain-containing protein [Thalassomonas actiniarum]